MDGMGGKTRMITMSTEGVTSVVGNYFEIKGAMTFFYKFLFYKNTLNRP